MTSGRRTRGVHAALLGLGLLGCAGAAWPDDVLPGTPYEVEIVVFRHGAGPAEPAGVGTNAEPPLMSEATPLPPPALRLGGVASRLERSASYRVLVHAGWSVPARGEREARPVPLPPEADRQGLAGTVTFYRTRFLHLALDVTWRDPEGGEPHRLSQVRRVKPGSVHYFDAPEFGVIATVREAAPEGAEKPAG